MTGCKDKRSRLYFLIGGLLIIVFFFGGCLKKTDAEAGKENQKSVTFLNRVKETVKLQADEEIETAKTGWIEPDVCYRVAIWRAADVDGEYRHLRDYVFVINEDVDNIVVDYPSKNAHDSERYVNDACNFEIHLEDVNFDEKKDIIINLGNITTAGIQIHCAYIYDGANYVYNKSFERIPNYSVDNEQKCVLGYKSTTIYKYKYENGEFVLQR